MAVLGPGDGGSSTSGSTGNRSGAGTGTGASGKIKPVEIIPIAGGSTITIGGARFPGVTEAEQSGGVNAPTKRTEEGYDYTTRVNREARTASFSGWVKAAGLAALRNLRREKEPFAVAAGHVVMQRAVLEDLQETASQDAQAGAFDVTVEVKEAFQAEAGTSEIKAYASSGKKSGGILSGLHNYFASVGDAAAGQADEAVGQATSSGKKTGSTET